jgi:hypothetical protein
VTKHKSWLSIDSGKIRIGDVVQLKVKFGNVVKMQCPVCGCALALGAEKECPGCLSRYSKQDDGYRFDSLGVRQ